MKDSVGVVIWIPSALSPYDLLSAFRLRCTVHPQQGQPQPVGGGFQPGESEHSFIILSIISGYIPRVLNQ